MFISGSAGCSIRGLGTRVEDPGENSPADELPLVVLAVAASEDASLA